MFLNTSYWINILFIFIEIRPDLVVGSLGLRVNRLIGSGFKTMFNWNNKQALNLIEINIKD